MTMVTVRVIHNEQETIIELPAGANLRRSLLANGFTPYTTITRNLNCGGRGLCATCGVWIDAGIPAPTHWHDQLAARFGYPRLSCQISIDADITVRLVDDKVIWGGPRKDRRYRHPAGDGAHNRAQP
ncbi:MAG: (2Fe-2S)-binding protein [Chloroflexi bacterium]|nr:(2Fe-2S)-binding protein [Chloroflexota bacterium]